MTIETALGKIDALTECELKHCIQRIDEEINYYYICIKNYNSERLKKYGLPYLKRLEDKRKRFTEIRQKATTLEGVDKWRHIS